MIPFNAQPLTVLKLRYPQALVVVHDQESIALGHALPPSKMQEHRFDSTDGLRLFISRERLVPLSDE